MERREIWFVICNFSAKSAVSAMGFCNCDNKTVEGRIRSSRGLIRRGIDRSMWGELKKLRLTLPDVQITSNY
jgi:hypothetical protein